MVLVSVTIVLAQPNMKAPKSGNEGTVKVNQKGERQSNKNQSKYSGDGHQQQPGTNMKTPKSGQGTVKVDNKGERRSDKSQSHYSGDGHQQQAGTNMKAPKSGNEGTVNVNNKGERRSDKSQAHYSGDGHATQPGTNMHAPKSGTDGTVRVSNNKGVRKSDKSQAHYSGDISASSQASRMQPPKHDIAYVSVDYSKQRKQGKTISKYSGDMAPMESHMSGPKNSDGTVLIRGVDHKKMKQIAKYSGDLPPNALQKRSEMRMAKNYEVSHYKGDISIRTLQQRAKKIRKKNKTIANYRGDIIVHKRKEGMHPSSVYRGGKVKNSYAAKEKYRKRMLEKNNRNADIETPNYLKDKKKNKDMRPKYDSRESEIWY